MKRSAILGIFVCAVALLAAALGDAVVEGISNAGILWRGDYTDRSSLDLLPVFLLSLAAVIGVQGASLLGRARHFRISRRTLLLSASRTLVPREIVRLIPAIFALQMLVLFCMETSEQTVVYGHALGGLLWLGGPVAVSVIVHACFSIAGAFAVSSFLSALGSALTRIVKCLFAFVACAPQAAVLSVERVFCAQKLIVTASLVERGPPQAVTR